MIALAILGVLTVSFHSKKKSKSALSYSILTFVIALSILGTHHGVVEASNGVNNQFHAKTIRQTGYAPEY